MAIGSEICGCGQRTKPGSEPPTQVSLTLVAWRTLFYIHLKKCKLQQQDPSAKVLNQPLGKHHFALVAPVRVSLQHRQLLANGVITGVVCWH